VYFYLGELGDALTYALGAGTLFDVDEPSEYVETLLSKAIDEYCSSFVARSEQAIKEEAGEAAAPEQPIDKRLIELVERMVESSIGKVSYLPVMGIAIESRRLELVERVLRLCDTSPGEGEHEASTISMLAYTFSVATTTISSRPFRKKVGAQRRRLLAPSVPASSSRTSGCPLSSPL
jgi:26S proteasome regulatory subunit N2